MADDNDTRAARRGSARVVALSVAVLGAAVALWTGLVDHLALPGAPIHLPWILLPVLFAATERFVVHVEYGRDTHSISLNEIPLVLGLFFVGPAGLLLA